MRSAARWQLRLVDQSFFLLWLLRVGNIRISKAYTERERWKSRSALQPISVTPAPLSVPAPRPPAPRSAPLHLIFGQLRSVFPPLTCFDKLMVACTTSLAYMVPLLNWWLCYRFITFLFIFDFARQPTRSSLKIINRSFRYAAPCLWNELPTDLHEPRQIQSPALSPITHGSSSSSSSSLSPLASSLTRSVFHSELKTWLFRKSCAPITIIGH